MSEGVIDTCCLINVHASGHAAAILRTLGVPVHIPGAVKSEAIYLESKDTGGERTRIDVEALIRDLGLVVATPHANEIELYVALARELDDGEAMGLAIAKSRGLSLLTDERKATKRAISMSVPVISTPELVHGWAAHAASTTVSDAIARIERMARYSPSSKAQLFDWWQSNRPDRSTTVVVER